MKTSILILTATISALSLSACSSSADTKALKTKLSVCENFSDALQDLQSLRQRTNAPKGKMLNVALQYSENKQSAMEAVDWVYGYPPGRDPFTVKQEYYSQYCSPIWLKIRGK